MYKERLKLLREENNLKLQNISEMLGLEKDTYGKFEREYTTIPIAHLNTVCNYFKVSFDYIFNLTNEVKYDDSTQAIDKKKVALRLKEFRKNNKLTQEKLAQVLNVAGSTIAGYEIGRYLIATPFLYDICKRYNVSADYILGKIDKPKYLYKNNP